MDDPFKHLLVGKRIRLLACTDPHTELRPGDLGTVRLVDCMDTVHVDWDGGSRLGLCADAGDRYELLTDDNEAYDASVGAALAFTASML